MTIIKNAKIFDGENFIDSTAVKFENGKILEILEESNDSKAIDAERRIVIPGFIDTHIHGIGGFDCMHEGAINRMAHILPKYGTTSFCPTSVTESHKVTNKYLEYVKEGMLLEDGAEVLGAHLEGPYISENKRGVHKINEIKKPSIESYNDLVQGYENIIRRITIAPEKSGAIELIKKLANEGITVSIGHTSASSNQVYEAANAGTIGATHTFNAMSSLHHRESSALAGILTDDRISAEFIADPTLVNKECVDIITRCKRGNCFFCTDSNSSAFMSDGTYKLGNSEVTVVDGISRIDDALAGGAISMDQGVKNLVEVVGIPLKDALRYGTLNPAKNLNIDKQKGRIALGMDADIVILNHDLSVAMTFIRGIKEYSSLY